MVEHSPHHLMVKGLCPAVATCNGRGTGKNVLQHMSLQAIEHPTNDELEEKLSFLSNPSEDQNEITFSIFFEASKKNWGANICSQIWRAEIWRNLGSRGHQFIIGVLQFEANLNQVKQWLSWVVLMTRDNFAFICETELSESNSRFAGCLGIEGQQKKNQQNSLEFEISIFNSYLPNEVPFSMVEGSNSDKRSSLLSH